MITTNCGRNSTALVTISPAAYRPAASAESTLRAMITSMFDRAKNASSANPLCIASVTTVAARVPVTDRPVLAWPAQDVGTRPRP